MPTFSEIVDRALFRRCGIDVEPLRSWWRRPIDSDRTTEVLLKDSFADSLLGDGIWQSVQGLDRSDAARRVSAEWLNSAVAAVLENSDVHLEGAPIWLSWLREAAEAFGLWHLRAPEHPSDFNREALLAGMEFIRSGFPALALLHWKHVSRAARHRVRRERILQKRSSSIVKEAQLFAEALGAPAPVVEGLDSDATMEAVVRWYDGLRDSHILDHFWRDHLAYLLRLKEMDPEAGVLALIRTAEKRRPVTFATLQKLVLAYRNRTDELLLGMRSFT